MTRMNPPYFTAIFGVFRLLAGASALAACTLEHHAPLRAAELPPLAPPVLHSSRLWIELGENTPDTQCVKPGAERLLCFEQVQGTFRQSLQRSLWTSFPEVGSRSGAPAADDYVLIVDLSVEALPPDASGPGWSAGARGKYRLLRGGKTLVAEGLVSRSRPEFAYGAPLGFGAAEAVQAIAARIGADLGALPESREIPARPLPAVAEDKPEGSRVEQKPAAPAVNQPSAPPVSAPLAGL